MITEHTSSIDDATSLQLSDHLRLLVLPVLLAVGIGIAIYYSHAENATRIKESYTEHQLREFSETKAYIEQQFGYLYRGLRTIARLPDVGTIGLTGFNKEHSKHVIQELYNNMAGDIALSEVYITPKEFTPETTNPLTGQDWEPAIMFDELIVGRTVLGKTEDHPSEIEEIEIHEYRLIRQQISQLQLLYPSIKSITGLDYPALSGNEVITCDNTRLDPKSPNDIDRSGIVYSLPFYDTPGMFKGVISGIVLSHAIREWLPGHHYVLYNLDYNYAISNEVVPAQDLLQQIQQTTADHVSFLRNEKLNIIDGSTTWQLWVGHDLDEYEQYYYSHSNRFLYPIFSLIPFILGLMLYIYLINNLRFKRTLRAANQSLEASIRLRTKELEASRDEAQQASAAKTEFLSRMSHELRTPMNAIMGFTQLLALDEANLTSKQAAHLKEIGTASEHLLNLINEVLDLSRIELGKLVTKNTDVDVQEITQESISLVQNDAAKRNISITNHFADSQFTVHADPIRLTQVLVNLLSNAVKYNQDSGQIIIDGEITDNNQLRIRVSDQGGGLTQEEIDSLFEPFHRLSRNMHIDGVGIGLTISRHLMELMGGTIGVESTHGEGATFWIQIALASTSE